MNRAAGNKEKYLKHHLRHSVYARILAMMLTMVLFLTSSGVQVLAQDVANGTAAEAAQTEEGTIQTAADEGQPEDPIPTGDPQGSSETISEVTPTPMEDLSVTPTLSPSEDLQVTPTPAQTEEPQATPTPTEETGVTPTPSPSEDDPTPSPTPTAEAEGKLTQDQLTFQIGSTSTEAETGLVEIKVHYSLGKDVEQPVRTRIYIEDQANMDFSQFERNRYTDDDGHSFKLSSNPDARKYYIQYYVNPGEDFTQTFKMSVSGLEAGESADFTVRLEVNSDPIPENWIVDSNVYNLTYTQPESGESSNSIWDDLQAGKTVTLTASVGGARYTQTIMIRRGMEHSYEAAGLGSDMSTYEYEIIINGQKQIAFCMQPNLPGPNEEKSYTFNDLNSNLIAKICYYAKHPETGFFAQEAENWTYSQRFIIGHIAASKVYSELGKGHSNWSLCANDTAKAAAQRLIDYCENSPHMGFSKDSVGVAGYYKDGGNWRQKSENITFTADQNRTYEINLSDTNLKCHINGNETGQTGKVTISAGQSFYLSAPLNVGEQQFVSQAQSVLRLDKLTAQEIITGKNTQTLAFVYGDADTDMYTAQFKVSWNTGAKISVNKTDKDNNEPLSGAEFTVYDSTGTNVAKMIDGENAVLTDNNDGTYSLSEPLLKGSYILRETKAPSGYVTADDISFMIDANGTISSASVELQNDGTYCFTVVDEKNETSISGTKTWNVPNGFKLPDSITVRLLRNGEPIYDNATSDSGETQSIAGWTEKTVTAADSWKYSWENLAKYPTDENGKKTGAAYEYTVKEIAIDGAAIDSDGKFILDDGRGTFVPTVQDKVNINNKITGTTEVSGEKIWHDDQDSDGIRPESIIVKLLQADKSKIGTSEETWTEYRTATVNEEGNWKYSFTNLPRYSDDGSIEYVYSVDESNVPSGYTKRIEGNNIINTHVASTSVWFTGKKELEGRKLLKDEFKFNLYEVTSSGEVVRKLQTTTNNANGSFYFNSIHYSGSGTHYYRITEEKETLGGVTYDETIYEIRVVVSVGGINNDYYTTSKYITKVVGSEKTTVDDIVFHNKYQASGELVIKNIMKTLENSPLAAGQFTFELKDEQGNVLQTASNNADGSVIFDAIKYTEKDIDKEYTYTVSEVNNNVTGVTYDNAIYTVKVKVQDSDPSDGTLRITQETLKDVTPVDTMTYTNTFKGSVKVYKTGQDDVVLPGAKFQLYVQNASGEWVLYKADETTPEEYVTDENGMIAVDDLAAGNYYFVETEAPLGYIISKEEDGSSKKYYFTIGIEDGSAGIVENAKVNAELYIENEANPDDTTIEVTKLITRHDEEFDLIDETFYVALFDDEDLTNRVSDIRPIEFMNGSASTVYFTGLKFGKTYYVAETDENGNVIETGVFCEDGKFKVDFASGNYAEIHEGDGTQTIIFENQILTIPRKYYKEGKLTVTKKLLGANGSEKSSNGVFYAGIFADKEYTQLSDLAEENIVKLDLNGNSSVSKTVKIALHPEETTTLYVTEVDENGKPVSDADGFKYVVTVDGSEVTMDSDHKTATVVITNREEKSSSSGTKNTSGEMTGTSSTRTAVRTGDETPIDLFVWMLGISVIVMSSLVFVQKRRKKDEI